MTASTCRTEQSATFDVEILCPQPETVYNYADSEVPIVDYTVLAAESSYYVDSLA